MRKRIDVELVQRLYGQGLSYDAIAGLLNISKSGVARAVKGTTEDYRRRNAESAARWNKANPERRRKTGRESARRLRAQLRAEMIAAYGGKCACCGEAEEVFLSIDHISGDGAEHRRQLGGRSRGVEVYRWLKANGWPKENFRLLCANCQVGYYRCGTCPHQERSSD